MTQRKLSHILGNDFEIVQISFLSFCPLNNVANNFSILIKTKIIFITGHYDPGQFYRLFVDCIFIRRPVNLRKCDALI